MMELVGTTLGSYRIDRLLGEGGMGAVYQAYDLSLQRDVAIKIIHPHFARRPEFRERFMQEARIMARLDHPGIVKVFLLGKEGDMLYLPMEYIKGGNLRQMLDRLIQSHNWIPLNEALLLIQQLCQVVEYAHKNGVLHRDIKPANLMLKPEPTDGLPFRIVLTDLGLAKLLEGLGMTQEGTSLGTPAYMSPEQASGKPTDARSDVYSLGVLLFELAVGCLPFEIRTITEATRYHTQVPPPAPRSIRPDLPEAVERVILKALEKDPNKRYASAAALGTALSGSPSSATEIDHQAGPGMSSLVTEYQASVIASSQLGSASLLTVFGSEPNEPRGASVFAGQSVPPGPDSHIQILQKDQTAKVLKLPAGTVTIGRGKENHIVLNDEKVSRRHAQITWDGLEYHVMDLNSSNGTYLENAKLLPGIQEVLRPNQNLRIGDSWLRIILSTTQAQQSGIRSSVGSTLLYASSSAGVVGASVTPQQLSVEPGGSATASIALLNQSPNVDQFLLSITGIPDTWVASMPPAVDLLPGEQKEVVLTLLIPRAPGSRAGRHPLILRITSQRDTSQIVEVKPTLTISAYSQLKVELQPERLRTGQTGRLLIDNQGNASETVFVELKDREKALNFDLAQKQLSVPEGKALATEYTARLRKPYWLGAEKTYPITAQVKTSQGEPRSFPAEIVSRAILPVWIIPIMLFICLVLGMGAFLGNSVLSRAAAVSRQTAIGLTSSNTGLTATATWLLQDDDRDGLTNGQELQLNTLPGQQDTDNDGLSDGQEVNTYHTDPLQPDTDRDGLKDGEEVSRGLNPLLVDTDGDGINDPQDLAPISTSTGTADAASTQEAANQTSTAIANLTLSAQNATATQNALNAMQAQNSINATNTQIALNATQTQDSINAAAAQAAANATATAQALACFVGNWVPVVSDGGMARLQVEQPNQSTFTFHGWGECTPDDCDWGVINVPASTPKLVGTFQFSFKSTRVTLECMANNQLSAEVFDHYTDGRTDRTSLYTLKRQLVVFPRPGQVQVTLVAPQASP
jgi:eukaryotic-like serine/threonine-protein kinase